MKAGFPIGKLLTLALVCALSSTPALAEKGGGHGGGKGEHGQKDKGGGNNAGKGAKGDKHGGKGGTQKAKAKGGDRSDVRVGAFFGDRHRDAVRSYYATNYGGGKSCPPGLAKKNNGCMPPGQARKWNLGQPLPVGVVTYPVPPAVVVQLPAPPIGHKYVRVAGDILLIAVGSQMVVDGISDLMRL